MARLFAIADLHLSASGAKPMDIFGDHWKDHPAKIAASWTAEVRDEDLVLIVGHLVGPQARRGGARLDVPRTPPRQETDDQRQP